MGSSAKVAELASDGTRLLRVCDVSVSAVLDGVQCKVRISMERRCSKNRLTTTVCSSSQPFLMLGGMFCCRYFCGPNAIKTAAQAKQQKKRPRKGEKAKTVTKTQSKAAKTTEDEGPSKRKGKQAKKGAAGKAAEAPPSKKAAGKARGGKGAAKGGRMKVQRALHDRSYLFA